MWPRGDNPGGNYFHLPEGTVPGSIEQGRDRRAGQPPRSPRVGGSSAVGGLPPIRAGRGFPDRQASAISAGSTSPLMTDYAPPSAALGGPMHRAGSARRMQGYRTVPQKRKARWYILTKDGDKSIIQAEKRVVLQKTGVKIPLRDLRLLDAALLSTHSAGKILVRDEAIVFVLEHVRMIITADQVLIPLDVESRRLTEFLGRVESAILDDHEGALHGDSDDDNKSEALSSVLSRQMRTTGEVDTEAGAPYATLPPAGSGFGLNARGIVEGDSQSEKPIPFELQVLEVGLSEICATLEHQERALSSEAYPALDALTKNVNPETLERVRRVKTKHQRLSGRVKGVRDQLEAFLDDEKDLWKMCLTVQQELAEDGQVNYALPRSLKAPYAQASHAFQRLKSKSLTNREMYSLGVSLGTRRSSEGAAAAPVEPAAQMRSAESAPPEAVGRPPTPVGAPSPTPPKPRRGGDSDRPSRAPIAMMEPPSPMRGRRRRQAAPPLGSLGPMGSFGRRGGDVGSDLDSDESHHLDDTLAMEGLMQSHMDEVDHLLESYFVQSDRVYRKLEALGEYVEDTEDLINIELDSNRNRLIVLDVVLSTATVAMGIFAIVAGILGENVVIPEFLTKNIWGFIGLNGGTLAVCVLTFAVIIGYCRSRKWF